MAAMIRATRKGGAVAHLMRAESAPSVCGRVMVLIPGGEGLRLCKTCARITGVQMDIDTRTQDGLPVVTDWTEVEQSFIKGANDSFTLGMCREVLAQYESNPEDYATPHMLRHVAMMRAALSLHTGRDYVDPVDSVAPSMNRGGGDGMVNRNSKSVARPKGATPNQRAALLRQAAFIDSLFSQLFEIQGKEITEDEKDYAVKSYTDEAFDKMTRADIDKQFKGNSALIDRLKEEIRKAKSETRKAELPSQALTVGLGDICKYEGKFFKIKVSQAGNPYAMVWDGHGWDYDSAKGVIRKLKPEHLATAEDAAQFGHMFHRCVFCSRPLAKDESEAVGYGPDCAEKRGLPWG